ncbi:FKBP-type peptidyl-prolyl cis-trans isomerase [Vulgatibacter sp.]|uniref:FKBP-type peptidyl-prolyl cis-trans isomerase n=1 Tax=Vulgatibacter sp. TaxID=1971226 RepID=UPI003566BCBB
MNQIRILTAVALALFVTACNENKPAETAPAAEQQQPEKATPTAGAEAQQPKELPAPPDVAAAPADAQKTESGLASKVLQPGTGDKKPGPEDVVTVHYTGWTTDGKMFDSSVTRGQPANFPLNRVIPGWTEGLQLMTVGEKRRFWIPEELAYKGRPGPQGTLVFDVELVAIKEAPKPIPAPEDVKAPPRDARKLPSGVAIKTLQKGTGTQKPKATDKVEVHYTGWTTDGKMFDSSVVRGRPATFPLGAVIPGWTQALQEMVKGEKARIWIPEELAYKGRPGAPQGMLVFDVELLDIVAPSTPSPRPQPSAPPPAGTTKPKAPAPK